MKLSIIVPIYNVEKYLPQCIDSILNQDYVDFELILVNDGSPDDSLSICRQYAEKDKRVRVINKPNGGSTSSRKAGAKIAKGEYVICVDGDDYVEQGYFSCVARSLDEFNPDMVVLSHYSLEDNKKILRKDFVVQGLLQDKEYEEVRDKFIYDPTDKNISNPGIISYSLWCKVVRREIYVKAQEQVDDKIVIGEDMLFSHDRIVLISTHIVSDIEYIATQNAIMKAGKIVDVGTTDELVKQIEGKVWTCTIPARDLGQYEMHLRIINQRGEDNNQVSIRYLSEKSEIEGSAPISPRLEDLYLWLFPQAEHEKEGN